MNSPRTKFNLTQRFFFDAAHTLSREIETAPSKRIHGHTYQVEISIAGALDAASGMVVDLGFVRKAIAPVRESLDHHLLNEVEGLGIPTLENLCAFIARALLASLPQLSSVRVWRDGMGDGCTLILAT